MTNIKCDECDEESRWSVLSYRLCDKHKEQAMQKMLDHGMIVSEDGQKYYPKEIWGSGI